MLLPLVTRLAQILNIKPQQIEQTISLLDEGATVPFIARYRKEITGGLDDTQLRKLAEKLNYLRELDERRNTILNSILEQGKLSAELENKINAADNKTSLEDLYLPYKPKRRTKAQIAKEAGLEALCLAILNMQQQDPSQLAINYLNDKITTCEEALTGARFIFLDLAAENAELLAMLRKQLYNQALICATVISGKEEQGIKFSDYFAHQEIFHKIPSHRALALLRAQNEGVLRLEIAYPELQTLAKHERSSYEQLIAETMLIKQNQAASEWLNESVRPSWKSKIFPSLSNELISQMHELAEEEAIKVFATNLHNLLLQAPAGSKTTLGLDPGIRTGVKVALIDPTGKLLTTNTVYPFTHKREEAMLTLAKLIEQYQVELISIGNGTASRETEQLVVDLLKEFKQIKAQIVIVSEAGASIYSASEFAAKEFPKLDVTLRGAVSIARRLQDPLAELVKIEPKSIGVGQYQHDVNQTKLAKMLDNVVEDCVNAVGVDLNTASSALLARVSGLNTVIAHNLVTYRDKQGQFKNRQELLNVARLGEKTFEQCAGFLRINHGDNPLDASAVHPESYPLVELIAKELQLNLKQLIGNSTLLKTIRPNEFTSHGYGIPTIQDVLTELDKPGRDPRGEFKTAQFKEGVNSIDDLLVGMQLEGVITNVANFGAFVDIGVHQDGLVHISALSDRYISDPNSVVKVGQIVKVSVIEVDVKRKRIALSMKDLTKVEMPSKTTTNISVKPKATINAPVQNSMSAAFAKLKRN